MAVTLLCGFWPHATREAARTLLAAHPRLRVLPETCRPNDVRAGAEMPWVITVVPADLLLDGLTDERIGGLVARQIEEADAVLLLGEAGDDWETEQLRVLLRRIAPWSRPLDRRDCALPTGRADSPASPLTRGLHGYAVGVHAPVPENGVTSCVFRARRPFHPQRLHAALDEVTGQVLRSRGHFWLASRPEIVLTWESAGALSLVPADRWLDGQPRDRWDTVAAERALAAELDWDPYYGDRHHQLVFIGIDLDPVRIHRVLTRCLLTDAELADGSDAWRRLRDPFRATHPAIR